MNIKIYKGDILFDDAVNIRNNNEYIGIDTETTGLNPLNDKLCIIQIATKDSIYIIKYDKNVACKNLKYIFKDKNIFKVFHHANFDIRFLMRYLHITEINNVLCTKIAFKLLNGLNKNSSLKNLVNIYLGINLDKSQQLSDWSIEHLSQEQLIYAANDVKYLIPLWLKLKNDLEDNNLIKFAEQCYKFLPTQAYLQNNGIENIFIY